MISKTIGCRGTLFSDKLISKWVIKIVLKQLCTSEQILSFKNVCVDFEWFGEKHPAENG